MTRQTIDLSNRFVDQVQINEWFRSNKKKPLKYQTDTVLEAIRLHEKSNEPVVIAVAPSGGKTTMAICYMDLIMRANNKRVLVLAHNQVLLAEQFANSVYSMTVHANCVLYAGGKMEHICGTKHEHLDDYRVVITIPSAINGLKLKKFDSVIVDEAHQFYFAEQGMVERILNQNKGATQLLLSGTPSKFIARKFKNIIAVSVLEIMAMGMISDLHIKLCRSTYDFTKEQYNKNGDLLSDTKIENKKTKSSLDALLADVIVRLKSHIRVLSNNTPAVNAKSNWHVTSIGMGKTMIACHSVNQARYTRRYFNAQGVDVAISVAKDDKDSLEIERFRSDSNCMVLIVVDRGILGFDMPELINVVDMTCSTNPDTIFQLMARAFRLHPDDKPKCFYKLALADDAGYMYHVMDATISLCDKQNYTKYNGSNFLALRVIVKEKSDTHSGRKIKRDDNKSDDGGLKPKTKTHFIPAGFTSLNAFRDVYFKMKSGETVSEYAETSLRTIRNSYYGGRSFNDFNTTDELIKFLNEKLNNKRAA